MKITGWKWALAAVVMMAGLARAQAQATVIPHLDEYAKNATSTTSVDLDKKMLGLAGAFMNGHNSDDSSAKRLASKLEAIHVHTFEYDTDWAFDRKSVDDTRKIFNEAGWSHIVSVHEKSKGESEEDTDIYMHMVNGESQGLMIITVEPRELNFVEIVGQLSVEDLHDLHGNFGIPGDGKKKNKTGEKKEKMEAPAPAAPPAAPGVQALTAPAVPATAPELSYSDHAMSPQQ